MTAQRFPYHPSTSRVATAGGAASAAVYAARRAAGEKLMIISRCCTGPAVFPEVDTVCNFIVVKGPREPVV